MRLCQGKGENFVYVLSLSLYLHFENSAIVKLFSVCMNCIFWCWHEKCDQLYWKNSYTNHHDGNKATELGFYVNHTMILCLVQHNRSLATTFWHIKILLLSCSAGYVSSDNVSFLLLFPDFYVWGLVNNGSWDSVTFWKQGKFPCWQCNFTVKTVQYHLILIKLIP